MGSLFAPKGNGPVTQTPANNQNTLFSMQNSEQDPVSYAESMLQRSGGDAKAAFYLAAQEKGIDANQFLKQMQGIGDMRTMAMNMMTSNPRVRKLMSLFSTTK